MSTSITDKDFDKTFYSDGYQIGMNALEKGFSHQAVFEGLKKIYSSIDELNDTLAIFANKQSQSIECKKGCEWCCHQPIFALDYEINNLDNYLRNNLDKEDYDGIKTKAEFKNNRLKNLQKAELLNSKFPCPILKDGACQAYEVRPMACRIYISSNLQSCLKFYNNPEDKNSFPALMDFPMRVGRKMNEGFKAALKTIGVVAQEYRIEEGLAERMKKR